MGMLKEFKEFAVKGNMIDMAVGIIIGAAFGTIVKSLVADVIMPPIGYLIGNLNFDDLALQIAEKGADGEPVVIAYGKFLTALIAFLITAWVVFLLVKGVNNFKKKEEAKPAEPPKQEVLLGEIRDLLAKK